MKRILSLLCVLVFVLPSVRAAEFLRDTFSGSANGTGLASHTGEIGAVWTPNVYGGIVIQDGRLACVGGYWGGDFTPSGVPPSANYDIIVTVRPITLEGVGLALYSRWKDGVGGYELTISPWGLRLGYRTSPGNYVGFDEESVAWVANQDYTVRFEVKDGVKKVYLDGNPVPILTGNTENWETAPGVIRLLMRENSSVSTGFHVDSISAAENSVTSTPPSIVTHPTSQTKTVGESVSFTAAASGTPTPTYQWQKNGSDISGATSASFPIATVGAGDAGDYQVIATNSAGSATSNVATLTVNAAPVAPTITTQPTSATRTVGESVSFTAAASGTPTPTYQWQKNGSNISGATSASFPIATVGAGDAGDYRVIATNSAGSATSNVATLTVNAAPVAPTITTQPTSAIRTVGESVSFTVAATGAPSPTYQWKKDGVAIGGATSATYTIASVDAGHAGSYTATASNSEGSATSNAATLTVNPVVPTGGAASSGPDGNDYFVHIDLNDDAGTVARFEIDRANNTTPQPLFTVLDTGHVGIGTTAPVSSLDVAGGFTLGTTAGANLTLRSITAGRPWSIRDDAGVDRLRFSRGGTDQVFWDILKTPTSDGIAGQIWYTNPSASDPAGERMRLTSAGNLGIGTSTPTAHLQVTGAADHTNGNVLINGNSAPSLFLANNNGGLLTQIMSWDGAGDDQMAGARIGTRSHTSKSAHVHFTTDDTIRMTIRDSGNVGIGTSVPGKKLEVVGEIIGRNSASAGGQAVDLQATSEGAIFWVNASYDPLNPAAGWSRAMTMALDGKIGIGTASPRALLNVEGGSVVFDGPVGGIYTTGTEAPFTGTGVLLRGKGTTPSVVAQTGNADGTSAFAVYNSSNAELFRVSSNGKSYFNTGNLGIGTTNPSAKLDVAGAVHIGSGNENIANTPAGPGSIPNGLSVQDTSGANVAIAVGKTTTNSAGLIWRDGSTPAAELYTFSQAFPLQLSASTLYFNAGSGNPHAMTIDSSGRVGVGTTTPIQKFEVEGNAVITGSLKTDINGFADASLTLGSDHAPGQGGSLKLQSSQGGDFRFSNEAGKFTLRRVGGEAGELLKFETSVAEFGSSIKSFGLDVQNTAIRNVANPFFDTDATNLAYVKDHNPFEWTSPSSSAHLKTSITHLGIGTDAPTRALEVRGTGPLFYVEHNAFQPTIAYPSGGEANSGSMRFKHSAFAGGWGAEIRNEDVGSFGGNLSIFTTHRHLGENSTPVRRLEVTTEGLLRLYHKRDETAGWEFSVQDAAGTDDGAGSGGLAFRQATKNAVGAERNYTAMTHFWIGSGGDVGIGTTNPNGYKLAVNGSIHAKEIVVESDPAFWPDYVFADAYQLMPLAKVEEHIKEHRHLPGVPSAKEIGNKGLGLGAMQSTLLAKLEELTLHLIEQEKRIRRLEEENLALRSNR